MSELAISIDKVSYAIGNNKLLRDITFDIPAGTKFALLGTNGAGKSLLIDIITGMVKPKAGTVQIFGKSFHSQKERVGVLFDKVAYMPFLKVSEFLNYIRLAYGVGNKHLSYLYKELDLQPISSKKVTHLSPGERKRVGMTVALMHKPDLMIMDEPTSALDPFMRDNFWKLPMKEGSTLFVTSHSWDEVREHCDLVAFIEKGKLLATPKKPSEFLDETILPGHQKLKISKLNFDIAIINGSARVYEDNDSYHVFTNDLTDLIAKVNEKTSSYSVLPKRLEDVYHYYRTHQE
jgi:ABC-2 type transport system ATP-binding protein